MKVYEKPSLKRHSLETSRTVANTCWGYHKKKSPTWWYDKNGTSHGFVSFTIGPGQDCGEVIDLLHVTWYQNRDALNSGAGQVMTTGQSVVTDAGQTVYPFDDTHTYLLDAGGNEGQPFSGENNLILDNEDMS